MEDFAHASMLRMIRAGLVAQGLAPPPTPPIASARAPLSAKRALLAAISAAHGGLALLRAADVLPTLPEEPLLRALRLAAGPEDLLARWGRLERFAHSRHRVIWRAAPGEIRLRHVALAGHETPTAEEDLIVFATLTVLAEMIGAPGLRAGPAEGGAPFREGGRWRAAPAGGAVEWLWRHEAAPMRPAPAGRVSGETPADRVRARVAADPCRSWSLGGLAAELGVSPRSLQRRLSDDGKSLTQLIAACRLESAAAALAESAAGLAEIGFTCGFSDQAHFTRAFRRLVGCTPGHYRASFAKR